MEHEIEFVSAGRTFAGVLFEPDTRDPTPRAGVMVLHGGTGFSAHERDRARMLSELGYVAFAPDLFGEVFQSRARGIEVITGLVGDPLALRTRLADALTCLRARSTIDPSRVAAIGFCFGGLAALELQLQVYAGAMHGFTERNLDRPGARYHEATDRRSWQALRAFLDETLA